MHVLDCFRYMLWWCEKEYPLNTLQFYKWDQTLLWSELEGCGLPLQSWMWLGVCACGSSFALTGAQKMALSSLSLSCPMAVSQGSAEGYFFRSRVWNREQRGEAERNWDFKSMALTDVRVSCFLSSAVDIYKNFIHFHSVRNCFFKIHRLPTTTLDALSFPFSLDITT